MGPNCSILSSVVVRSCEAVCGEIPTRWPKETSSVPELEEWDAADDESTEERMMIMPRSMRANGMWRPRWRKAMKTRSSAITWQGSSLAAQGSSLAATSNRSRPD